MLGSRDIWGDTRIELLPAVETRFENLFTGELVKSERHGNTESIPLTRLFASFPAALLIPIHVAAANPYYATPKSFRLPHWALQ